MDVESVVRPAVESAGLEFVEATFRRENGRQILRVTVDREGGLDLDTLATISEKVSRRLDLKDFGSGRYQLEVSTPGIERPLKTPAQFRRFVGDRVRVKTAEPVEGAHVHEGLLAEVEDGAIVVNVDGARRRIPLEGVASARTVVDWTAELRGRSA